MKKYKSESCNNINSFFENYKFIEKIKKQFPTANWEDSLAWGQIDSKLWLIDELINLNINLGLVFIFGGWYGTLAKFMFESNLKLEKIRSFDIDEESIEISETINRKYILDNWKFKSTNIDIFDITYPFKYYTLRRDRSKVILNEKPDTVINTSSEHMNSDWLNEIPSKTLVVIQNNDFFEGSGHINCVENLDDLKEKFKLSEILYLGEIRLEKYTRYMIIGYK